MATFNEIYHSYLKGVQGITPISGQQGITSLATPIAPNINSDNNINSTGTAPTSTTTSAPTTMNAPFTTAYSMTPMDTVLGMMSPVTGLGTLAAKGYGYPSLSYAIGALTGLGSMGLGGAGGASNSSGATDTGDTGSEAANDAATAAANASVGVGGGSTGSTGSTGAASSPGDTGGAGGDDGAGGSDGGGADGAGDGGDGYAMGGRVNFAEGSDIIPFEKIKLFDLLGEELYVDWDSFSEIYDLHGGDRMWKGISGRPGYAMGGRVSYLQGGIVSLLGDYYGKR
jgi:hypothetical protein